MKKRIAAALGALVVSSALFTIPAYASCEATGLCPKTHGQFAPSRAKAAPAATASKHAQKAGSHRVRKTSQRRHGARSRDVALSGNRGVVVSLIKSMAPRYGVPTWFALRIAKIESGYNPRVRGAAGEYGVFQLKCSTARGIGFRGNCGSLLNASTNVQYGLKHLSLAVRSSRGNLRLAASKHNGGLGRRSLVPAYVRRVF
jgi:soluble lytic murein transglycosylase-like protein